MVRRDRALKTPHFNNYWSFDSVTNSIKIDYENLSLVQADNK